MSKFIRNLALFIAGLPLTTSKAAPIPAADAPRIDDPSKAVSLRPLNLDINNLFASHRSHSSHGSHASHSSHYSGSGGSYAGAGSGSTYGAGGTTTPSGTAAPSSSSNSTAPAALTSSGQPGLSLDEKRRLQVMRVQIKLLSLGLFDGQVSGVLDSKTKAALKLFQDLKHLPQTGLMTTETLNALEVPAVN